MKVCIQRVSEACVFIDGIKKDSIGQGLLILFCVEQGDDESKLSWVTEKIINLRIFEDETGKMSRSLVDINGEILVISQFTLAGDCSHGRRPDFSKAEKPDTAKKIYLEFIDMLKKSINSHVGCGEFGADMKVSLINDGPVTLMIER